MFTTADNIIALAAQVGITATLWERGGKCRLYVQQKRKDLSIFLECDGDGEMITGAALKVFCSVNQHPNWIKAETLVYRNAYARFAAAYVGALYHDVVLEPVGGEYQAAGFGLNIAAMIAEERARFWQALAHEAGIENLFPAKPEVSEAVKAKAQADFEAESDGDYLRRLYREQN